MNVSFYGHVRQYQNIQAEIDANMRDVLLSGQYVMGPMLKRFEKELAAYHNMKYAIGVGNGTDAIWLSLLALGIYVSFLAVITLILLGGWWLWGRLYRGDRSDVGRVAKNSAVQMVAALMTRAIDFAFAMLRLRLLGPAG